MLDLAAGSPTPPMRINSASGEIKTVRSATMSLLPLRGCVRDFLVSAP